MQPIPRFRPGQRWSDVQAADMNRLVDAVNALTGMTGDGLVEVQHIGAGPLTVGLNVDRLLPRIPKTPVEFGRPVTEFSSGDTVLLDLSDTNGDPIGGRITIYLAPDKESVEVSYETTDRLSFVRFTLPDSDDVEGVLVGVMTATGTSVTPKLLTPYTGESPDDFENESAQSDSWNRSVQGENDGMFMRIQTRMAFNHLASPPKLYAFYREFAFDSLGMLKSVSSETRVTVDEPVDCTI